MMNRHGKRLFSSDKRLDVKDDDTDKAAQLIKKFKDWDSKADEKRSEIEDKQENRREMVAEKVWDIRVENDQAFYCNGCNRPVDLDNPQLSVKAAQKEYCNNCYKDMEDVDTIKTIRDKLTKAEVQGVKLERKSDRVEEIEFESEDGESLTLFIGDRIAGNVRHGFRTRRGGLDE